MLASFPARMVNQKRTDLGIPNRFSLNSSRFRYLRLFRVSCGKLFGCASYARVWNLFASARFRLVLFVRSTEASMSNGTQIPFGTGGPPAHLVGPSENGLLLSLPLVAYGALKEHLTVREFGQGCVLWNAGDRPSQLYFPQSGLISI